MKNNQQYPNSFVDVIKPSNKQTTPFIYPDEEEKQSDNDERLISLLRRLCELLLPSVNVKADLLAMLSIYDHSETLQQRANQLHITKQVFHRHVKKMKRKLGLL
jgi:hypothetical protein